MKNIEHIKSFLDYLNMALYCNIKNDTDPASQYRQGGFTRLKNLYRSSYAPASEKIPFYRLNINLNNLLDKYERGYNLSGDEREMIAVFIDNSEIPDLRVKDILSIRFHQHTRNKRNRLMYSMNIKSKDKEASFVAVDFSTSSL